MQSADTTEQHMKNKVSWTVTLKAEKPLPCSMQRGTISTNDRGNPNTTTKMDQAHRLAPVHGGGREPTGGAGNRGVAVPQPEAQVRPWARRPVASFLKVGGWRGLY
jgi:hypothetical protein